jgi:hypothetical protein
MAIKKLQDFALMRLQLAESKSKSGNTIVRGEFASYGKPTANKRFYGENIWKQEITRLDEAMADRRVFGELDHPTDGRTSLKRVSHIVTGMHLENGILVGEAEILPTVEGLQLEALLKSGCKVGVSSRGYGSVKTNDEGIDVVQEDFKLQTFDFVADPADSTAYPEAVFEGVEFPTDEVLDESNRKDADIRGHATRDAELAAQWAEMLKAEDAVAKATPAPEVKEEDPKDLPAELLKKVAEMRGELSDKIRGELLSDPKVAGAATALETIKQILLPFITNADEASVTEKKDTEISRLKNKLAEQELRIKDLEEERDKVAAVAKESAYKLYLERTLSEDPDAELVRNLIGDVTEFSSSADLKARLEAVRGELAIKRDADLKKQEQLAAEAAKTQELIQVVQEEAEARVSQLEEAVEKLAGANKDLALRLYTEKKLRGNTRSAKIRTLVENTTVSSKEDVDELIEQYSAPAAHDSDESGAFRAKVRRRLKSQTRESDAIEEATPVENNLLHGVPMAEVRKLSGIKS